MNKPLAIDLFCGLGGWTEGLLAEGYDVTGFDIEAHDYGDGKRYPAKLVIRDVLTIHGSELKDAALIVASPPCQEFSYMAMPWSRAKAIAAEYRSGQRDAKKLTALFDACFRIQREAIEAAGHHIPIVVENVRGAQPWVGRSKWNFGSYYLWGDVPALMPITMRFKSQGMNWSDRTKHGQDFTRIAGRQAEGLKLPRNGHRHTRHLTNQAEHGTKFSQSGDAWFDGTPRDANGQKGPSALSSKSKSRKAASAEIARIPFALASWIASVYRPKMELSEAR